MVAVGGEVTALAFEAQRERVGRLDLDVDVERERDGERVEARSEVRGRGRSTGVAPPNGTVAPRAAPGSDDPAPRRARPGDAGGRAALRARRHRDRRPPRHRAARRAGAGGRRPQHRVPRLQLPRLRHDRRASRSSSGRATGGRPTMSPPRGSGWASRSDCSRRRWSAGSPGPAALALGGSGAVLDNAVTYLRISAVGTPFVLVALVGNGYLRGVQDTRTPLTIAVGANLLNLVVEIVLVYGLDLGVAGSAWGTVLAQVVAAAAFLLILPGRLRASGAIARGRPPRAAPARPRRAPPVRAHRRAARPPSPSPRRSRHGSTRRRWPATRSPCRSRRSSRSSSTVSPSRGRR